MRRLPPVPVFLLLSGVSAAAFALYSTISAIYRIRVVGLDPLELILVGTVLEVSVFLFEIPTGVVADVFSRRLSLLIGLALIGAGFATEALHPSFANVLVAQLLWGVGYTFTSGARTAWLVDELGDRPVGPVLLRGSQMAQLGALLGIVGSVSLASVSLPLPMLVAGGLQLALCGLLIGVMPETGFTPRPPEQRRSWRALFETFGEGVQVVRRRRGVAFLMGIALLMGVASEPIDRLWELHLLASFTFPDLLGLDPIFWFGAINAGGLLLGFGVMGIVRRYARIDDPGRALRTLGWLHAGIALALAAFVLAGSFAVAVMAWWTLSVLRRMTGPFTDTWLNQRIDSRIRATVLSMHTQADSLGQVAGGPGLGALARTFGVAAGLLASASILTPIPLLYARLRSTFAADRS